MVQYLFQTEKIEDSRRGKSHIISNIDTCKEVSSFISTTLGPYGMDKCFYGKNLFISNDGAKIMESMDYSHPVAKMLASLSNSQDNEVGDGTTSVIVLASEILYSLKDLIKDDLNIDKMRDSLNEIKLKCIEKLKDLVIECTPEKLQLLGETCLTSKYVRHDKAHFSSMLIDGLSGENKLYIDQISGGSLSSSFLSDGIVFEKTFTYAGAQQQSKKFVNPKICCINLELEWKKERDNAEIHINTVEEYQKVVDAEWNIIKEKLDDIVESGANIVVSTSSIGDYATQYFAKRNIVSVGRYKHIDRLVEAFGGSLSNDTKNLNLGQCELFEEKQLGGKRYNYFISKDLKIKTLILRGPGDEILGEIERSVHDAVCVIKLALKHGRIVTGGGSTEMQLSKFLRESSFDVCDEKVFLYRNISRAFEKIPLQLAENFGLHSIIAVQALRKEHTESTSYGISVTGVSDMSDLGVYEPFEVKLNMIKAVFDLTDAVLSIDSTIISKKK